MPGVRIDAVREPRHHVDAHLFAAVQRDGAVAAVRGVAFARIGTLETLLPVRATRHKLTRVAQGGIKHTQSRKVVAKCALALPTLAAGELRLDDFPIHHGNVFVNGFKGVDGNEIPRLANFSGRRLWFCFLLVALAFFVFPFNSARTVALTIGRADLRCDRMFAQTPNPPTTRRAGRHAHVYVQYSYTHTHTHTHTHTNHTNHTCSHIHC